MRKDWKKKINEEAKKTLDNGSHHFIYVTNKNIHPSEEERFILSEFKYKDDVNVSIYDLSRITTALSYPEFSNRAYQILGMSVANDIKADQSEIAISTLLFSDESKQLRDEIIEVNIKAILFKYGLLTYEDVLQKMKISFQYDNMNIEFLAKKIISRLMSVEKVISKDDKLKLSDSEYRIINIANDNFIKMQDNDIKLLCNELCINNKDASELLKSAIEIIVRGRNFEDRDDALNDNFLKIISKPIFRCRKDRIFNVLSKTNVANMKQYGMYIDQILKTDTFDIYRALGQRTNIIALLDSSVAMTLMFGLEFGEINSRFGIAAHALKRMCDLHEIELCIPNQYLNEIASHGRLALEKLNIYTSMPNSIKQYLKSSRNAYISHYEHVNEKLSQDGESITLIEFLHHFGIVEGSQTYSIENKIQSILERHNIKVVKTNARSLDLFNQVKNKKIYENRLIIEHDASVLAFLKESIDKGFIFVTYYYAMKELVQNISRVLADTPTRVIDFLSMAKSKSLYSESNIDIIDLLKFIDESKIIPLAEKLDEIKNIKQVYKLNDIIDKYREAYGTDWEPNADDIQKVLEENVEGCSDVDITN